VLSLGGTFNGILQIDLQRLSLVFLTIGFVIWQIFYWRSPFPLKTSLDPALMVWIVAYTISTLTHLSSGRVWIGVWYAGLYGGVWFVLTDLRRRGLPGHWITDGVLLTTIPLMLLAVIEIDSWFPAWLSLNSVDVTFAPPRPPSALGNPNAFGLVLAMMIPFGIMRARYSRRFQDRILWGLWLIFALVILYFTYSRGAWLAAGAGILILIGLSLLRSKWNGKVWWQHLSFQARFGVWIGIFIGVILAAGLVWVSSDVFNTPQRETGTRLLFYELAAKDFKAHPVTGTGPFTFGLTILRSESVPPEQPHAHAHNLTLNIAAEMGIPGALALIVTVVLIFRRLYHALQQSIGVNEWAHNAACSAALAAFGVHGFVDMPMIMPALMLLMIGILAASTSDDEPSQRRNYFRVVPLTLWVVVLISGWWSHWVYTDYVRGQQLLQFGHYQQGAAVLKTVAERQPNLALYHAQYAYACGLAASIGDGAALQPGIQAYQRALELEVPHALWWQNLAALYWQTGNHTQAVGAMNQAVRYAPDDPDMRINLGVYYEEAGMLEQAEAMYVQALEEEPLWGYSSFWQSTSFRSQILADYPVALTPYMTAERLWMEGQEAAAVDALERTLLHDPTQPKPYINLARLYVSSGQLDRAEEYLDAAELLIKTDLDLAWMDYVEAQIAFARGDNAQGEHYLHLARKLVLPGVTGRSMYLGNEVAYYQFLRLTVKGVRLPQVLSLGPDPILIELLLAPS
jgi:O-antigen ligase/tetratricopeptide (TPR) repeat protein